MSSTSASALAPGLNTPLLINAIPGLYLILDPDLNIFLVSNAYLSATLTERSDLIGKYIFDVFPDNPAAPEANAVANLRHSLNRVIARKKPHTMPVQRYDVRNPAADGMFEVKYWKPTNTPVLDEAGQLVYIIHQVKEITQQHLAKQNQQRNQDLLSVVFQTIDDVVWDWNLLSNEITWSEGFNTKFGYSKHEIEPTIVSWYSRIHPDDRDRVQASIHTVIDHGLTVWSDFYRFKQKNGTYADILDRAFVLHDAEKKPYRMIGAMVDITEKKKAEREAQQSELRFKTLMESLPLMVWTALPSGEANYYNQRWTEYLGVPMHHILGQGWQQFIHPDDKQLTETQWQLAVSTGTNLHLENRWRSKETGEYRWFLAQATPIRNEKNEIILWVGSHTDIEVPKQFQETLQAQDEKIQRMLSQAPAHFCLVKGPEQIIDFATPNIKRLFGNRECVGLPLATAWPEIAEQGLTNLMKQVFDTGEPLHFWETKVMVDSFNNGEEREGYFNFTYQPFLAKTGQIEGVLILAIEVTDQVKAKQETEKLTSDLVAEKEKFQFLAETIPQFIWTTDPRGFHDYFNQRWIDYTGYTVEDSKGTEMWNNLLHPDDRERSRKRWDYSLQTGEFYEIEYRFKNKDGGYRWFLGQATPMRNAEGTIVKWFGTCTDIEEKKQAEEELLQINEELRKSNADLDSFVYTASHDLKLPIISMSRIFTELTKSAQFHTPDAEQLIVLFDKSLQQINATIQDLADIVKVQKSHDQSREMLPLTALTKEVMLSIQDMIKESGAQINTNFRAVPEVYFSRVHLKSILYNLLSNAIKYRSPERPPVITLTTTPEPGFTRLTVQDNGLGINLARHQNKLFQMFKRFHSHVPGSGIGLYIVNRLVQNQGGRIEVQSTVNEGTTFNVFLKDQP